MNKLSIAGLVAGTAVVTGFIVSKVIANKKKTAPTDDIWDDDFDAQCCDGCCCDEDIDVVSAGENTGDCAEAVSEAADEASESAESAAAEAASDEAVSDEEEKA